MHKHGGDIYTTSYELDYSANINPLGMPESVIIAAQAAVPDCMNYPDTQCRGLRKKLSETLDVPVKQIICGNGAAQLIFSLAAAQAPKKALLITPGFAEYEQALLTQNCEIVFYELKDGCGFVIQEDYLEVITPDLDMLFICNPNNPTGVLKEREFLLRVLEKCKEYHIRMVLDLCFLEFLDEPDACDMKAYLAEYPELFILRAFTKIYAMAGLRLGYGLCSDEGLLAKMQQVVQPWSVSVPAQAAGTAALDETAYVKRARALVSAERAWMMKELNDCGYTVYEATANFIFFKGEPGLTAYCAVNGILIRDCSNYRGLEEGYYRVAVRMHDENEKLIDVLKRR